MRTNIARDHNGHLGEAVRLLVHGRCLGKAFARVDVGDELLGRAVKVAVVLGETGDKILHKLGALDATCCERSARVCKGGTDP